MAFPPLVRMEHKQTLNKRLWLLQRCLFCSSPSVRDGALLGLASMDDTSAIYSLRKAIERESYVELKEDMMKVLKQLETKSDVTNSTDR